MSTVRVASEETMAEPAIKALTFDVFGTVVDWRSGVAREAEALLAPRGYSLDWPAFADRWRRLCAGPTRRRAL